MAVFNVCPRPSVRLSVLRGNLKHEHIPMIHPSGSNTLFCCSGWLQVVQVIGAAACATHYTRESLTVSVFFDKLCDAFWSIVSHSQRQFGLLDFYFIWKWLFIMMQILSPSIILPRLALPNGRGILSKALICSTCYFRLGLTVLVSTDVTSGSLLVKHERA